MKRKILFLIVTLLLYAAGAAAQQQVPIVSGVVTIDVSLQTNFLVILNQNVTSVVLQNQRPAEIVSILFTQNATGGYTVTFGGNISSSNLPTISTTANATTYVGLQYSSYSNTWFSVGSSGGGSGTVTSVSGTANQIDVATGTTTPVISLDSAIILPGTISGGNLAFTTGNTFTGTQDFTSATFLMPKAASAAPTTEDSWIWDTTNHRPTVGNGTNTSFLTWITSAPTTGHCANFSGTLGLLADSGAACGAALSGLTTGFIPKAGSASTIVNSLADDSITTANTFTYAGTGGISAPKYTATGSGAGAVVLTQGTAQGHATANTVTVEAPTAVTAYEMVLPITIPSGSNTFLSCTAANPSVCSFAAGGGLSAGTYFYTQGYAGNSATLTGPGANNTACNGFIVPPGGLSVGHIDFNVAVSSGAVNNDVGIYGPTGTLEAHIGAQQLTTTGDNKLAFSGGTQTLTAGKSLICFTSTGTALQLQSMNDNTTFFQYGGAITGGTTTGGALNGSVTFPADNPSIIAGNSISFVLYP